MTANILHRGHCLTCGWTGRAYADQWRAEWHAAKHAVRIKRTTHATEIIATRNGFRIDA